MRTFRAESHCTYVALWRLATSAKYRKIAHLFGVSWASICLIRYVCEAIVSILFAKYIQTPPPPSPG